MYMYVYIYIYIYITWYIACVGLTIKSACACACARCGISTGHKGTPQSQHYQHKRHNQKAAYRWVLAAGACLPSLQFEIKKKNHAVPPEKAPKKKPPHWLTYCMCAIDISHRQYEYDTYDTDCLPRTRMAQRLHAVYQRTDWVIPRCHLSVHFRISPIHFFCPAPFPRWETPRVHCARRRAEACRTDTTSEPIVRNAPWAKRYSMNGSKMLQTILVTCLDLSIISVA
jgi:hypothetical protein